MVKRREREERKKREGAVMLSSSVSSLNFASSRCPHLARGTRIYLHLASTPVYTHFTGSTFDTAASGARTSAHPLPLRSVAFSPPPLLGIPACLRSTSIPLAHLEPRKSLRYRNKQTSLDLTLSRSFHLVRSERGRDAPNPLALLRLSASFHLRTSGLKPSLCRRHTRARVKKGKAK